MTEELTEPLSPAVTEQQARDISSKFGTPFKPEQIVMIREPEI